MSNSLNWIQQTQDCQVSGELIPSEIEAAKPEAIPAEPHAVFAAVNNVHFS